MTDQITQQTKGINMRVQYKRMLSVLFVAGFAPAVLAQPAPDQQPLQEAFKLEEPAVVETNAAAMVERDPFWPIGYVPQSTVQTNSVAPVVTNTVVAMPTRIEELTPERMKALKSRINVGGIMKQGAKHYVLVNNQMVTVGDTIQIPFEGTAYRFIVRSLNDQDVTLEPLETQASSNSQKTGDH
jgi:hypothetical protein